jgi:hypothetical protein
MDRESPLKLLAIAGVYFEFLSSIQRIRESLCPQREISLPYSHSLNSTQFPSDADLIAHEHWTLTRQCLQHYIAIILMVTWQDK